MESLSALHCPTSGILMREELFNSPPPALTTRQGQP